VIVMASWVSAPSSPGVSVLLYTTHPDRDSERRRPAPNVDHHAGRGRVGARQRAASSGAR
jgi:hypothetical protein